MIDTLRKVPTLLSCVILIPLEVTILNHLTHFSGWWGLVTDDTFDCDMQPGVAGPAWEHLLTTGLSSCANGDKFARSPQV